jgi:hypothetical protein
VGAATGFLLDPVDFFESLLLLLFNIDVNVDTTLERVAASCERSV